MEMQLNWDAWGLEPLGEAMQLSCFVLMIMTLMEYVAIKRPATRWQMRAEGRSGWQSVCMGALLGWIPGCVGGFAAVSFYTHGFWRFGAVLAASVTALGDDAFRMWGMMPGLTFEISLGLTAAGIGLGLLANRIPALRQWKTRSHDHLQTHAEDRVPAHGHHHHHHHAHETAAPSQPARYRYLTLGIRLLLLTVLLW
ncbi:MAG: putative manganese transporter, partial [Bacteroidales bacterium]|nr:putative manganese transporter [Bacteroidales bacterium]